MLQYMLQYIQINTLGCLIQECVIITPSRSENQRCIGEKQEMFARGLKISRN